MCCYECYVVDLKLVGNNGGVGLMGGLNLLVCKYWLRGFCKKGEYCEFLYEYNLRKMLECNFFMRNGYCFNGEECLYLYIDFFFCLLFCLYYDMGFCFFGLFCLKKYVCWKFCLFYFVGFCFDGLECKEGVYMKWKIDLEKLMLMSEKKKEDEVVV